MTITPSSQFSGTVSLGCTGLSAFATCTFSSPSLTFAAGGAAQITQVAISTLTYSAKSEGNPLDRHSNLELELAGLFFLPGLLLAGFAASSKRLGTQNRLMQVGFRLLGLASVAGLTGCDAHLSTNNIAAGTYTVNVTRLVAPQLSYCRLRSRCDNATELWSAMAQEDTEDRNWRM